MDDFQEYVERGFMHATDGMELLQKKGNTAVIGIIIIAFFAVVQC